MMRVAAITLSVAGALAAAAPVPAQSDKQEKLGERLVNQSCVVCHLQQQITSGTYAPALSKATLGGNAEIMHAVIANGTARMPGFRYQFNRQQIDAIAAYIKTIPAPATAQPSGKAGRPGEAD